MKRITVSLPDELVDDIKRSAGGAGQVSAYVTKALVDYQEGEALAQILASWELATPVSDALRRQVAAELDGVGLLPTARHAERLAG